MRQRCTTTDGLTQAPNATFPAGCGSGALTITKAHSVRLRKHMTSVRCLRHLPPTETGALFYISIPITATTAAAIVVNHQSIGANHRRPCASWLRTRRRRGMRADTHAHDARTNEHRWMNAHGNAKLTLWPKFLLTQSTAFGSSEGKHPAVLFTSSPVSHSV